MRNGHSQGDSKNIMTNVMHHPRWDFGTEKAIEQN